jgi:hypothetical protein
MTHAWFELATDADVAELMRRFGDFHDGCIRELFAWSNYRVESNAHMRADWGENVVNVRAHFQRQSLELGSIEIWFEDITELHIRPAPKGYDWIIDEATLLLRDGLVYWADAKGVDPDALQRSERTCVAARRARWRTTEAWMGAALQYGPPGAPV